MEDTLCKIGSVFMIAVPFCLGFSFGWWSLMKWNWAEKIPDWGWVIFVPFAVGYLTWYFGWEVPKIFTKYYQACMTYWGS
jgi:hypothetical protein